MLNNPVTQQSGYHPEVSRKHKPANSELRLRLVRDRTDDSVPDHARYEGPKYDYCKQCMNDSDRYEEQTSVLPDFHVLALKYHQKVTRNWGIGLKPI